MKKKMEFMNIGNDVYCRYVSFKITSGEKIVLSSWFWYINLECV